jgi:hypothetical protein
MATAERHLERRVPAAAPARETSCARLPTQPSCFYMKGSAAADRDDLALVMAGLSKLLRSGGHTILLPKLREALV